MARLVPRSRGGTHGRAGDRHGLGRRCIGQCGGGNQEAEATRRAQLGDRGPDRLKAAIRRFSKPLADLVARDANEGDTRLLVTDFLCEGLGFDKYADLTTEYQVKGEFADLGCASIASWWPSSRSNGSPPSSRPATSAK